MAEITNEYSSFPEEIDNFQTFKDVDSTSASLIDQLRTYQNNDDYANASALLANNPVLKDYIIDARIINWLLEAQRNCEIETKKRKQHIYIQSEVPEQWSIGDVFIKIPGGN